MDVKGHRVSPSPGRPWRASTDKQGWVVKIVPFPPNVSKGGRLETTAELIILAREGDRSARERLARRYYCTLRQWAHGRLPASARSLSDTDDLVQSTVVQALNSMERFEPRHEGAFLAYLRKILLNQIRDEMRRVRRRPQTGESAEALVSREASPLERAIGMESLERYDRALALLPEHSQQAVILRVEFGMAYQALADLLGMSSANAARMCVARALVHLTKELKAGDGRG
jgi:RNA polymerase sigma-70 factor, ECF subfamily